VEGTQQETLAILISYSKPRKHRWWDCSSKLQ